MQSNEDLNKVYRDFVSLLEVTFINNQKNFDCSKLKNKEVIQQILRDENFRTFSSVRIILECIFAEAVNVSVESVVESLVFRYEYDFSSSRQPPEDDALNEILIAESGPLLHHADRILEKSMDTY